MRFVSVRFKIYHHHCTPSCHYYQDCRVIDISRHATPYKLIAATSISKKTWGPRHPRLQAANLPLSGLPNPLMLCGQPWRKRGLHRSPRGMDHSPVEKARCRRKGNMMGTTTNIGSSMQYDLCDHYQPHRCNMQMYQSSFPI
jgi:hypothetical protein